MCILNMLPKKKKGERILFSNDIIQLIIFLNELPKETHEKIIIFIQIFLIISEVLAFFYIRYITRDY